MGGPRFLAGAGTIEHVGVLLVGLGWGGDCWVGLGPGSQGGGLRGGPGL